MKALPSSKTSLTEFFLQALLSFHLKAHKGFTFLAPVPLSAYQTGIPTRPAHTRSPHPAALGHLHPLHKGSAHRSTSRFGGPHGSGLTPHPAGFPHGRPAAPPAPRRPPRRGRPPCPRPALRRRPALPPRSRSPRPSPQRRARGAAPRGAARPPPRRRPGREGPQRAARAAGGSGPRPRTHRGWGGAGRLRDGRAGSGARPPHGASAMAAAAPTEAAAAGAGGGSGTAARGHSPRGRGAAAGTTAPGSPQQRGGRRETQCAAPRRAGKRVWKERAPLSSAFLPHSAIVPHSLPQTHRAPAPTPARPQHAQPSPFLSPGTSFHKIVLRCDVNL